jgi:hypothetical protein
VGENVTLIVHFAPAATLVPQVEVTANSELAFIDAILSALPPVFVRLTVCAGLVVPTACFLKFSGVVGDKLTTPVFSRTLTVFELLLARTRSAFLSPLKSPTATNQSSIPSG